MMPVALFSLILACGQFDFCSCLSSNHAWERQFFLPGCSEKCSSPDGENSYVLCPLMKTYIGREPRQPLQVGNWMVGWGKRRNPE